MIIDINIDIDIKQVIKGLELPKETEFVGYVVHLPDSNEFLVMVQEDNYIENRMWAKLPEMAKKYKELDKARQEANRYGKGAHACILFDIGEQYVLANIKTMDIV